MIVLERQGTGPLKRLLARTKRVWCPGWDNVHGYKMMDSEGTAILSCPGCIASLSKGALEDPSRLVQI